MTDTTIRENFYTREAEAGWTRDTTTGARLLELEGPRDPSAYRWSTEYDAERDCWYVTTPEGQSVTYYRTR
jgi:hypothetical protein